MENLHLQIIISLLIACNLWISGSSAAPSQYSIGIAPQDLSYYKSNVIKCKDGSKKFTREQLNDEFCDCPDGTDEPGTSACPEGRFYCKNAGHVPLTLFSSRVNDGICDCCDGSDEYNNGTVKCPNTCWEAGEVARQKLKRKIQTYQEGVTIRKQEVEQGKQAFAKDEADLSRLKSEEKILKDLVDKLKDHKERIEKAEEEERLKKEQEEKRLREAEMKANEHEKLSEEAPHDSKDGVHGEPAPQDILEEVSHAADETEDHIADADLAEHHGVAEHLAEDREDTDKFETTDHSKVDEEPTINIGTQDQESSEDTSGLSKEELGRLVASRWTGEDAGHKANDDGSTVNDEVNHENSAKEEDGGGYTSEIEDDRHKYDDDDDFEDDANDEYAEDHVDSEESYNPDEEGKTVFSDLTDSTSSSWLERVKQKVHNVVSSFNFFKTPVDLSEAERIRKEYADSKSKLTKIQSRISSLTEKLKHDFGKEKEFYSFYDRCFENKQNKYVYKVCPFKQASQVEGHSTTRLGQWEKFEESYRIMQFSNGDKCWNGPDRSLKVRLRCGLTNELADVDEPSRCEYVALLSTPVLCQEDKLKELQEKLEVMNTRQPQSHDEL
ncbi:glucosidase 2 subunit beta [Iris pallida]|uniref:Glucosidase 2 subunit beta n=1 Tax=Iris pallida TaxID=29817 RepID=A0AAX6I0I6_IRIPA|nr:glucosidase 2 subunit beta [Iris pallida]KAJ6827062.1 glucosidase 2 subunit beta [Iris pallida]KAJ6846759.1 glucosidase 2 subunit beta [Iris pallida]